MHPTRTPTTPLAQPTAGTTPVLGHVVRAALDGDRFRSEMLAWNAGADYLYHPGDAGPDDERTSRHG